MFILLSSNYASLNGFYYIYCSFLDYMSSFEWDPLYFFYFLGVKSSNYVSVIVLEEGFDAENIFFVIDFDEFTFYYIRKLFFVLFMD